MRNSQLKFSKIVGRENRKRGLMYQVLWTGQFLEEITWEPLKNLISYIDHVKHYEQSQKKITKPNEEPDENQMNMNLFSGAKKESPVQMYGAEGNVNEGESEQKRQIKIFEEEEEKKHRSGLSPQLINKFKSEMEEIEEQKKGKKLETRQQDKKDKLKMQESVLGQNIDSIQFKVPIELEINRVKVLLQKKICLKKSIDFDQLYNRQTKLLEISRLNPDISDQDSCLPNRKLKWVQIHRFSPSAIKVTPCLSLLEEQTNIQIKEIFKTNSLLWYALIVYGQNVGIFNAQELYSQKPRLFEKYLSEIME